MIRCKKNGACRIRYH